jgi:hypothetical protein
MTPTSGEDILLSLESKKKVDIKFSVQISGITFIRYDQNRKIGKPNNLKIWEQ